MWLKRYSFIVCVAFYMCSLFFYEHGKAWLSIAMFGVLLTSFFQESLRLHWQNFVATKSYVWLTLSVFILPLYLLNSSDLQYYYERVQIRAPFLALPFAFAGVITLSRSVYQKLLSLFVLLAFLVALGTFVNYLFNIDAINESYLRAKVMPSILNHVRLSIMLAMAAYIAFYLFRERFVWKYEIERWMFLTIAVCLFLFVHFYSVRSGLIALYAAVFVEIGYYIFKSRNYAKAAFIVLVLLSSLLIAVKYVPTLNNKWINTTADLHVYQTKAYPNFNSLTTRFISYDAAVVIFKESPLLGCGLGDIKEQTDRYFKEFYPMIDTPILPHNQFLFCLASMGIVGLIFFCITFFYPVFQKRNWSNRILIVHYAILFLSFQTEPMLETQLGVAYSLLFILLPLTQQHKE
ncbi:MAG: O-antigen ligase family protein [Bacteroidota bacterium]